MMIHPEVKSSVRRAAWLLLAMATLASGEARAQDTNPPELVRHQLGPMVISPTITLRDLGIDTNVYNDASPDPPKDFAFTIVPAFTATVGRGRASLDLSSATELVYFAQQRSERSVNEDFLATARFNLRRIVPLVEFGYLNTRERVSAEVDERARRIEERAAVGLDVIVTPKLSAIVRGDITRSRYNAEGSFSDRYLAYELNRDTPILSAGVRYVLTPLTSLAVTTEVSEIRFAESSDKNTDSRLTQVSVELNPRALISGAARVGYQSFELLSAEAPDFGGVVGSGNLLYRLQPGTALGFTYDRSVSYSFLPDQPYYVRQGFGVLLRRQIVPQWSLTFNGERYQHQYTGVALALDEQAERVAGGGVTLGYDIGPRTRFTAGLSYQNRKSDFENRSYDGLRVGTSIVYAF
jgi:hypothetical protein